MKLRPLENTVVHLKTQAEYDEYMQMCEDAGWMWYEGVKPKSINHWNDTKENTCVRVAVCLEYARIGYYRDIDVTILTLPELKAKLAGEEPKKTKKPTSYAITSPEQLKHGMKVTCTIEGKKIDDAKISIDKEKNIYICQDHKDGNFTKEKLGYKHSWIIKYSTDLDCFAACFSVQVKDLESADVTIKKAADSWTPDAPIYRRGRDWIMADKLCIDGKELTLAKAKEQEAKLRAAIRAITRYFPRSK